MNLNKKIIFGSIASFLALSPIVPAVLTPSHTVQAAKATTFKLNHNSYVYNAQGKRTYYQGQKTLRLITYFRHMYGALLDQALITMSY
ncbi:MAG: hypothetical protein ACRCZW_07815 [Lactobacillaceae bacterium]